MIFHLIGGGSFIIIFRTIILYKLKYKPKVLLNVEDMSLIKKKIETRI